MAPTLLRLQDEVDVQTRRARAAEKAFVSLYRELYVAPDPVPALQTAENESMFTYTMRSHAYQLLDTCLAATVSHVAVRKSIDAEKRISELVAEVTSLEEELGKLAVRSFGLMPLFVAVILS